MKKNKNLLFITQKVDENDQLLGFSMGWLRRLAENFPRIIVLCLEKGEFILPENVTVINLGKNEGASKPEQLFNFYKNIWRLRKDYDAVFVFMNAIWIVIGAWFWKIFRKKIYFWYAHKTIQWKHRLAEKLVDGVFTSTPEGFRIKSKKTRIIGQGIDTDMFKPAAGGREQGAKLKILSVGRIAPIKNYETLLKAAAILNGKGVDFFLTIIGEPVFPKDFEYEKRLQKQISETGLESRIAFLGKVPHKNLPAFYQSHRVFVNLGKTGSLDKTILEAMACGMAVISSNEAAVKFLPSELVTNGDNPENLVEKIEKASRQDVGEQLRRYVLENHSLDNLSEEIGFFINNQ